MRRVRLSSRRRNAACRSTPAEKLILNLSGLTFMDSSGLAVVLHLHRTCARSGYEFIVRGAPPQPMRVFEGCGTAAGYDF